MSHLVQNQTSRPFALDGGRVLAPGERAEVEPNDHDKAAEDEGLLARIQPQRKESKS